MAGIDKIYGTATQWDELHVWLKAHRPASLRSLYPRPAGQDQPIANFSHFEDEWLWMYCPIPWVLAQIDEQYRISKRRAAYAEVE